MMTALQHPLVVDYLSRLREETRRLPGGQARELYTDIETHLADALDRPGHPPTEAEVRQVLDRLGEPSELVDEAAGGADAEGHGTGGRAAGGYGVGATAGGPSAGPQDDPPPHGARQDPGRRETAALVLLVVSIPLLILWPMAALAWLAGMVLLVLSARWSMVEKVWGAAVLGAGPFLVALTGLVAWQVTEDESTCVVDEAGVETCVGDAAAAGGTNWLVVAVLVAYLVLYVVTLVRLARSAQRQV